MLLTTICSSNLKAMHVKDTDSFSSMNALFYNRLFTVHSFYQKKVLQSHVLQLYSCVTVERGYHDKTGLDALVTYVSDYMKKCGSIGTDLLIVDNPASGEVVTKLRKAGVEKIACTIKDKDHFSNIQSQVPQSVHVFHHDLLRMQKRGTLKVSRAEKEEKKILSSLQNISGLVILASGISDQDSLDIHRSLINRIMTREIDGFYSLQKMDWFIALSGRTVKIKKHLDSRHTVVTLLNSFYKHLDGITISYDDSCSVFQSNLDSLKSDEKSPLNSTRRKVSTVKGNDVCLVHFMPKFDVLQQLNLDERKMFKTFLRLISGPQRLIPALEKLVPGCGLGLIELGYGMADEVNQIPHDQFLQVYKDVKSLPEYEGSALHHLITGKDVPEEDDTGYFDIMSQNWKRHKK